MFKLSKRRVATITAAIEPGGLRQLIERIAPVCVDAIDWNAEGAELARSVDQTVADTDEPAVDELVTVLQEIDRFGDDIGRRALWSVIAADDTLLEIYEAFDDSRSAAIWVYLELPELYENAVMALECDERVSSGSSGGFRLGDEFGI